MVKRAKYRGKWGILGDFRGSWRIVKGTTFGREGEERRGREGDGARDSRVDAETERKSDVSGDGARDGTQGMREGEGDAKKRGITWQWGGQEGMRGRRTEKQERRRGRRTEKSSDVSARDGGQGWRARPSESGRDAKKREQWRQAAPRRTAPRRNCLNRQ